MARKASGRSVDTTCTMRTPFGRVLGGEKKATRSKRELRNRAKASLEREAQILEEVLNHAATGGVVIVPPLKPAIEARFGKTLALSTLYQMLSRHGWRKLAPHKSHPQADPAAWDAWKKTPPAAGRRSSGICVTGPLRLMFQDEARFGRISDVHRCWDKKPHRPLVRAMVTQQYNYAYGAVSRLMDALIR